MISFIDMCMYTCTVLTYNSGIAVDIVVGHVWLASNQVCQKLISLCFFLLFPDLVFFSTVLALHQLAYESHNVRLLLMGLKLSVHFTFF